MTAEEYRQRMIQAFHNADCDELISVCVLPTEKEFEHLEWLLKNHYKKEPCEDAISRTDAIRVASGYCHWSNIPAELAKLPSVSTEKTGRWIPVSERLPEDLETVNISWVNHNPESYYMDIKDKPFTATGVYFNGQWYWWSTLCIDTLAEYSHNYYDIIDDDIEITAWMPLPQPYEPQESEE